MLQVLSGNVLSYRAVSKSTVQIELSSINKLIEITTLEPWVINRNDHVVVAGEEDNKTGKFIGYAYNNRTKNVIGMYEVSTIGALLFIIAGFFFIWAVFPIIHIYLGFKMLGKKKLCCQAREMVANTY